MVNFSRFPRITAHCNYRNTSSLQNRAVSLKVSLAALAGQADSSIQPDKDFTSYKIELANF